MRCTYDPRARRFYLSTYWTVSRGGGALERAVLCGAAGCCWVLNEASTSAFSDSIGDMTCTYDRQAKRFYLSTFWTSGGANNTYDKFGQTRRRGNVTVGSGLIVAATTTDDPTKEWNLFFIPGSYARPPFAHAISHTSIFSFPVFPPSPPPFPPSNDGINSNPDWRAPLHFNSSRLTMFCMLGPVARV
ncbi:unnamed protein product [Closterium sp. Naga37s-1]|nr:unnamed protein product [Closterium sp. Naga37s-1]